MYNIQMNHGIDTTNLRRILFQDCFEKDKKDSPQQKQKSISGLSKTMMKVVLTLQNLIAQKYSLG